MSETAEADLARLQAENGRLTQAAAQPAAAPVAAASEAALWLQINDLTRGNAAALRRAEELAKQLEAARAAPAPTPATATAAAEAKPTADLSLSQLADNDARIAKLLSENTRLNEDVKSSTQELSRLARQLRLAQEQGGTPVAGAPAGPADGARLAELTRELEELRASQEKLTTENRRLVAAAPAGDTGQTARQLVALQADLGRLRAENEQLKPAAAAAADLPAMQARATQAEQALAEATKQREALSAEKNALAQRLTDSAAKPSVDPAQVQAMRAQLGEALDEANAARRAGEAWRKQLEEAKETIALAEAAKARATAAGAQGESAQLAELRRALAAAESAEAAGRGTVAQLRTQLEQAGRVQAEAAPGGATAELAALRRQLQDALGKLSAAQTAGDSSTQRLAEAATRLATAATEKEDAVRKVAVLNTKIDTLNAELGTARRAAAQGSPLAAELAQAREAGEKLTSQLGSANRTVAELNARNGSLQQDLEVAKQSAAAALAAQAAAAKAAPGDAMRLELATLQNQVRALEAQSDEERKNSARDISTYASQLQTARETNRALTEANRALLQARGSEDVSSKSEIEQANSRLKAIQGELEKSKTEQTRLVADLESRNRELESLRVAGRAPVLERDNLRGQVEDLFNRLSAAERQMAQLKQVADTAKAEAEKARADAATMQAKHGDAIKSAEQHGTSVAELTGLNEKLAADKAALERQVAQTKQSSEQVLTDLADLKARVAAGSKTTQEQLAVINELGATNEKLQGQVKEHGAQMAALQAANSRLSVAGESAAAFRAELADFKTRLAESQKAVEQQSATVAELTGANAKLATELKELQAQQGTLRTENARLAQGDAARQEAEQRAASLTAAAAQLATAQRDLTAARADVTRLNDTVQALERDRTNRVAQLQQENAAITARLRQAQSTLDQIASAARLINGGGATGGLPAPAAFSNAPAAPVAGGSAPVTPAPRIHAVTEGDSLTRISVRYYGTGSRWQEIYEANREVLKGENALRPGQRLRIP